MDNVGYDITENYLTNKDLSLPKRYFDAPESKKVFVEDNNVGNFNGEIENYIEQANNF